MIAADCHLHRHTNRSPAAAPITTAAQSVFICALPDADALSVP